MKPLQASAFLFFTFLLCFQNNTMAQHNHSHLDGLRKKVPVVPNYVFNKDSLKGFDESTITKTAHEEHFTGQDKKRLAYLLKRDFIDEKYFNGFVTAPNIFKAPYTEANLKQLRVKPEVVIENNNGEIAWTHRRWKRSAEIFFFSNQTAKAVTKKILFNCDHTQLEIWDPVTGDINEFAAGVKYNDSTAEALLGFEPEA